MTRDSAPLLMLSRLYGDEVMSAIFSEGETIASWLEVERALTSAEVSVGLVTTEDAGLIHGAAQLEHIDREKLWTDSRNVGLPILPLVRQVASRLPSGPAGWVHYGASSHDVMDTALSLQIQRAGDRLAELVTQFGDRLAALTLEHRGTVMSARTQGQNAIPTTLGAKLAVFVAQLGNCLVLLRQAQRRAAVVSLYGAAGTSAALGEHAAPVRRELARGLHLGDPPVPWHVARENVVLFGQHCALISAVCGRFAREVIDLSRTEIGELGEPYGYDRGASSTVAQKANPVFCEAVVGMNAVAAGLAAPLYRAVEAGHERAAGEWHMEWETLPKVAQLAAGCLVCVVDVAGGLRVSPEAMSRNLHLNGGTVMAEAYMMALAPRLGRNRSHDVVYDAARRARGTGDHLQQALLDELAHLGLDDALELGSLPGPEQYLGEAERICDDAVRVWRETTRADAQDD